MSIEPPRIESTRRGTGPDPVGIIAIGVVIAVLGGIAGAWIVVEIAYVALAIGAVFAFVGLVALAVSIGIRHADEYR